MIGSSQFVMAGTNICAASKQLTDALQLLHGCLILKTSLTENTNQVVDIYGPGRIFARPAFPEQIIAKGDCLLRALDEKRDAGLLSRGLQDNLARSYRHSSSVRSKPAMERLLFALLDLRSEFSAWQLPTFCLPITRYELADWIGVRPETISRLFAKLVEDEIVYLDRSRRICIQNWANLEGYAAIGSTQGSSGSAASALSVF